MDLRGRLPIGSYHYIVTTDGQYLYNGTGSLMDSVTIPHLTSSYILDTYATESYISSSDIETNTFTASIAKITTLTVTNGNVLINTATGLNSVGAGAGSTATGIGSVAIGNNAATTADSAISIGLNAGASTIGDISIGLESQAIGADAVAIGSQTFATNWDATAIGAGAVARFSSSTAIGALAQTTTTNQIVLGIAGQVTTIPGGLVVTNFITGSLYGTASFALTSSILRFATASAVPPVNSASVAIWIDINVSGSIFKLPLYQ